MVTQRSGGAGLLVGVGALLAAAGVPAAGVVAGVVAGDPGEHRQPGLLGGVPARGAVQGLSLEGSLERLGEGVVGAAADRAHRADYAELAAELGVVLRAVLRLYEQHWRPMEVSFGQENYDAYFDAFMRHYLTVKTGDIPNVRAVYEAFKSYARRLDVEDGGVDALIAHVQAYAGYYCAMALSCETDKALAQAFHDLRELKVDVKYPLLRELYRDYATDILTHDDFTAALRLIESYVFSRAICAISTNSLNTTFATLRGSLKKDRYLGSIMVMFMLLPSYRRFPNDEEFRRELVVRDMYNRPRRSYWLRRLENFGRKERVIVDNYTVIMPQNSNLSDAWQQKLGDDWLRIHESKLNTFGNLTLTGYNSEYSDKPFAVKRDMVPGGLKASPLQVNEGLGLLQRWDEAATDDRAARLAATVARIWGQPALDDNMLEQYRPKTRQQASRYGLEDYPHLALGLPMRSLFDKLRVELLALDPNITEEFLKFYIAYKAETNVVDVVPQASRLRLSLNMPFPELSDEKGLAKDVTNLGRWGNGDVEVGLSTEEDSSYVLGLIRQSLGRQLSNGAVAND